MPWRSNFLVFNSTFSLDFQIRPNLFRFVFDWSFWSDLFWQLFLVCYLLVFCEILESLLQLTPLADCLTDWFSKVYYSWLSWLTVWLTAVFLLSSVVFSNVHSGWLNWLADWVHPLDYLPPNFSPCSIQLSTFLSAGDIPLLMLKDVFAEHGVKKWERIHLLLCWVRKKIFFIFSCLVLSEPL